MLLPFRRAIIGELAVQWLWGQTCQWRQSIRRIGGVMRGLFPAHVLRRRWIMVEQNRRYESASTEKAIDTVLGG